MMGTFCNFLNGEQSNEFAGYLVLDAASRQTSGAHKYYLELAVRRFG